MYQRVGTQFGEFQIRSVLGAGGMAAVYLAVHGPTGQQVALKILSAQLSHIDSFRQRFELEAQITARLEHPNIVPVIAYGAVDDSLYIAMRYVPGGTLHDKFVLDGSVSLQTTAHYLADIAAALDLAHAHGVIHRDLKLANVLLDEDGRALLSDFGIARLIESSLHLTESGSVLGSPHYMSPEQNEGKPLDARSDLYSLAVMAFLMVTGQFPFHADTPVAIALQHVTKPPPRPSAINPQLPLALDGVILKGLAKARDERFTSASEFAAAFQRSIGDYDTRTVVNLPQLNRSRPTPVRPPTPSTLPPVPLPIAMNGPLDEPTSPSAPLRRSLWRFGLVGVGFGAVMIAAFAGLLVLSRIPGLAGAEATRAPVTATPAPPVATRTVGPGTAGTPSESARAVTTTPLPLTPERTLNLTQTPPTIVVITPQSPYTVIIKAVDRPSNVRVAPDINAGVIAQLYLDDTASVIARTGPDFGEPIWYLIRTQAGVVGWVRGDVVELLPIGSYPTSVPTAVTVPAPTPTVVAPPVALTARAAITQTLRATLSR